MARKTKIIATIGPASASAETVAAMVRAGLDVARLNFSHGDHDSHRAAIGWVRDAARSQGRAVAILQDIQGPRIRVGTFPGGSVELEVGSRVSLLPGLGEGGRDRIFVQHLDSIELAPGNRVLVADGMVGLMVDEVGPGEIVATVISGGVVADHKGIALPGATIGLPAVTPKDEVDLAFGLKVGVDLVAASFVTSGADIRSVRAIAGDVPVIAKVERVDAYDNLADILAEADGVMVARGDLGVEMGFEKLPRVQKEIIARTRAAGALSITATEMLESMVTSARPTRAEVTDVANAVLDGSDAVMLSAETAVGRHPVRTVEVMSAICAEAEQTPGYPQRISGGFLEDDIPFPTAIAHAAAETAGDLGLATVVAFTESGKTALLVSRFRPNSRIVAFTPIEATYRRLAAVWGVTPLLFPRFASTDEMIAHAERVLLERGLVVPGEWVAMVAGIPPNQRASTNLLKLHTVGAASTAV